MQQNNKVYTELTFKSCKKCSLHATRRTVVWGRGAAPAEILFIGEAPARVDDLRGAPFLGPAGRLLEGIVTKASQRCGAPREPTCFFTNTIMCRPVQKLGGDAREPSQTEILACTGNVMQVAKIVHPQIVVFVGKVAARYYAKEFPVNEAIVHTDFLLKQGGANSPYYITTLRKMEEVVERIFYAA
jgi:uracil-DNA glycosylase family 4